MRRLVPIALAALLSTDCSASNEPLPFVESTHTYELTTYLPGLEQNARIVKTLRNVRAYLDDGRVVSVQEMNRLDAEARRAKFGAMSPAFAKGIRSAAPDELVEVGFFFEMGHLPFEAERGLRSTDDGERLRSQAALKESIKTGRTAAEAALRDEGILIDHTYATIPLILGRAIPSHIERAARLPMITVALGAGPSEMVLHSAKNGVTDAEIHSTFNKAGHWGAGQKIAHIEDTLAGVYDTHEAFSEAEVDPNTGYRVTYQIEPPDCVEDADCPRLYTRAVCIPLGHPGHARQCVTVHASECMSVAAGTTGGMPWGAGKARFYYPNDGDPAYPSNMCYPATYLQAYDWLAENSVTTVNESFGCKPGHGYQAGRDLEGLAADWFARYFNMAISKAAGNQEGLENPLDPACPYTLNSTCVGANRIGGTGMSSYSSWTNLNGPHPSGDGPVWTDREEPDITMFGGDIYQRRGGGRRS